MKKYFLHYIVILFSISSNLVLGVEHRQEDSAYPLGGVWRKNLPPIYQDCHTEMAQIEMESSSKSDRDALEDISDSSFGQVHALCRFRVYFQDPGKEMIESLDITNLSDQIFISGGHVITKTEPLSFCSIVKDRVTLNEEMKNKKRSITTTLESMTKLSKYIENQEELIKRMDESRSLVMQTTHEYEGLKQRAELIRDFEQNHDSECACKEEGYKKHVYDAEQIIIRMIDISLSKLNYNDASLDILGRSIPLEWIKNIILHIHSRLDMCPYCLKSLHIKMKQWNQLIKERILKRTNQNFLAFVSSRQEYIPSTIYLYTLPNNVYRGSSMRSLGIDRYANQELREEELPIFADLSLIVQIPISFYEIYT